MSASARGLSAFLGHNGLPWLRFEMMFMIGFLLNYCVITIYLLSMNLLKKISATALCTNGFIPSGSLRYSQLNLHIGVATRPRHPHQIQSTGGVRIVQPKVVCWGP
jgi:hypothetical protein